MAAQKEGEATDTLRVGPAGKGRGKRRDTSRGRKKTRNSKKSKVKLEIANPSDESSNVNGKKSIKKKSRKKKSENAVTSVVMDPTLRVLRCTYIRVPSTRNTEAS